MVWEHMRTSEWGRMMRDHRKLRAFELADELVIEVYRATRDFPRDELYGLVSQLRRAAVSVATNIVEGCGRHTKKEYMHFVGTAFASLRETGYLLDLSTRLQYLEPATGYALLERQSETARVLAALIRSHRQPK